MRPSAFRKFDFFLFLPIVLITSFSLLIISSTYPDAAKQQLIFAILGFTVYFLLLSIDYRYLKNFYLPIFAILVAVLLAVIVFGPEVRGASRWINIGGFRFQPAEFTKPLILVVLAGFLSKNYEAQVSLRFIIRSLPWIVVPTVLVFLQPDLGTALSFLVVWGGMLFLSPIPLGYFFGLGLISILIAPLLWHILLPYQKTRILVFINPMQDTLGAGYNVLQAMIAVGSGKIIGRGFGRGPQSHLRFLPEHHTDFIFASLAEEWGFVGALVLLGLFTILILRMILVSQRSANIFGFYLCVGAVFLFLSQLLINIGMNVGIMPITGIPLPLVSYGGSSLIGHMMILSLVQNVAIRSKN